MWKNIDLGKCVSFIESGFLRKGEDSSLSASVKPAITISRMTGAGGHTVASSLAGYLQTCIPECGEWTVFDRNLVEKILEEHRLHERIAGFMQEGHKAMLTDVVEELIGLHPGSWTLLQKTNATILHLAQIGNVILVGRGASVITGALKTAFHVRLVGSLEKRIKWMEQVHNLDKESALRSVKKGDEGRRRYLKDNFDQDIDNPILYHLIINTDMVRHDEAARLIGDEVIKRFKLNKQEKAEGSKIRTVHR